MRRIVIGCVRSCRPERMSNPFPWDYSSHLYVSFLEYEIMCQRLWVWQRQRVQVLGKLTKSSSIKQVIFFRLLIGALKCSCLMFRYLLFTHDTQRANRTVVLPNICYRFLSHSQELLDECAVFAYGSIYYFHIMVHFLSSTLHDTFN